MNRNSISIELMRTTYCNNDSLPHIIEKLFWNLDEDMNGNNGEEYLWDKAKAKGFDSNLRYITQLYEDTMDDGWYDWDDHRRHVIADFKKLIGAAHATEIPLLTGNMDLVGGYPLSDIIYPPSISKRYTSKNMMKFWTNSALKIQNMRIGTQPIYVVDDAHDVLLRCTNLTCLHGENFGVLMVLMALGCEFDNTWTLAEKDATNGSVEKDKKWISNCCFRFHFKLECR